MTCRTHDDLRTVRDLLQTWREAELETARQCSSGGEPKQAMYHYGLADAYNLAAETLTSYFLADEGAADA